MKTFFYNIGYFLSESFRTIRFNPLSNIFSVIGTGLILFLLAMVLVGWSVGDGIVVALQDEAEISAYFSDTVNQEQAKQLVDQIQDLTGVQRATYIDEAKAYELNQKLLGDEASILELFDENPFEAYIDIRINLNNMDQVLSKVSALKGIEYIRDNRDVLEKLKGIVNAVKIAGLMIAAAVGITTLIIISHMIRQGIYNNKEQINTLRLLGAPSGFISFPFILAGTLLTMMGGSMAALMVIIIMNHGYNQIRDFMLFLPMPKVETLRDNISLVIMTISIALGIVGSLFGVSSIRKSDQ